MAMNKKNKTTVRVSQASKILQYLESGKVLTTTEATRRFGCQSVSSRISELRNKGYNINTVRKTVKNVGPVTGYQLA